MDNTDRKYPSYGLLGRRLPYSFSPRIHGLLGNKEYGLIELSEEELSGFMEEKAFSGINVTIPYKQAVIPYLDELSDEAREIGAVNTIVRLQDGRLFGDNTDIFGMEYLLGSADIDLRGKHVLILGSGGTSLTARALCRKAGAASAEVVSRKGSLNYDNVSERKGTEVIINTTPVGTFPGNGESPIDISIFPELYAVVDVIYNPRRTELIMDAEKAGLRTASGLRMLIAQAVRAHELFFGKQAEASVVEDIYRILKNDLMNINIIGMPGCGKTTVARELSLLCGKAFLDSDIFVENDAGMSIPEIFSEYGETYFRELETEAVKELGKMTGTVIATGGGVVLREENMRALHQNGPGVFLERELSELGREGRPLSGSLDDLKRIYDTRIEKYRGYADFIFTNEDEPRLVAERIWKKLYEAPDY